MKAGLGKEPAVRVIRETDAGLMERYPYNYKGDASEYRLSCYHDETMAGVHVTLVAECGGKIVGYVNVCPPGTARHREMFLGDDEAYLYDLYVIRAYRGRGVGTRLLEEALAFCEGKADYVFLHVMPENLAAKALYMKAGFVAEGTLEIANGTECVMARRHGAKHGEGDEGK